LWLAAALVGNFLAMKWLRRFTDHGSPLGWAGALGFALLCVGLATVARIGFGWLIGPTLPFTTYFPAILVVALFGGALAGILAIGLSVVVVWWAFTPPYYEFAPLTLPQLANIALFSFSAGLIVWLAVVHRNLLAKFERQEKQRDLLVGEIEHRGKNILTVVESLILQTIGDNDRAQTLIKRIRAVVSTQDILDASSNRTVDLRAILAEELLASHGSARIRLDGPTVNLTAPAARAMRLVFHELATNALKHGALSDTTGKVTVDWLANGSNVEVIWHERDGPKVAAPSSYNFGSRLIIRTLKQLDAKFEPTFAETGYRYRIVLPRSAAEMTAG
jgi:two-component sensor histidine kinase